MLIKCLIRKRRYLSKDITNRSRISLNLRLSVGVISKMEEVTESTCVTLPVPLCIEVNRKDHPRQFTTYTLFKEVVIEVERLETVRLERL
jgi:hypothetical protein